MDQAHSDIPPLSRAGLDRAAELRPHEGILDSLREDPATRVLMVRGDSAPVSGSGSLVYRTPADVPSGARWGLLGMRNDIGYLVAAFGADAVLPEDSDALVSWGTLRGVGGELDDFDAGAFVESVCLARWFSEHDFCPACGARAELVQAGWARRCEGCGREHFPRMDPAVIVAPHDGERLLLGANAAWGGTMYSCFAGFVEAGESLEATVHREVAEEAGVSLSEVSYRGSQAWPYPRSLMLGFHARVEEGSVARADGEEIVSVRWFTREEIAAGLRGEAEFRLPGRASIAHSLIAAWCEG